MARGRLDLLDSFAVLGLMLLLEPLCLHKFGATPGKALLFLRLTRSDGSYFSYAEGFHRTLRVILLGLGLSLREVQGALAQLTRQNLVVPQGQRYQLRA